MTTNASNPTTTAAWNRERAALREDFILFQLENDVFFRVCEASGDEITPQKIRTLYLSDLWSGKRPIKLEHLPTLDIIGDLIEQTEGRA